MTEYIIRTGPETQPPEGQTVNYHGFNLTELFLREDLQRLEEGLRRFLGQVGWPTTLDQDRTLESLRGFVEEASTAPLGIAYLNLGYLVNAELRNASIPIHPRTQLPAHVGSLQLWLTRLLPSAVTLSAFVNLEASATERLNAILDAVYTQELELREGVTYYFPGTMKAQDVQNCLWDIRRSVESLLARYVQGVFLSLHEDSLPVCPAIDVLSLQHIPIGNDEETAEWVDENRRFLRCVGILGVPVESFRYDEYLLFQSSFPAISKDRWGREQEKAYRVLSSLDLFDTAQRESTFGSAGRALLYYGEEVFRHIGEIHALQELLALEIDRVAELRLETEFGEEIPEAALLRKLEDRFKKLHRMQSGMGVRSFHLARLGHELESQIDLIVHDLPKFQSIRPRPGQEEKPFPQNMLDFMEYRMSLLQSEVRILEEAFGDEMTLTNARLNYELQRRMDRLSWIMLALTVVSVVIAFLSIGELPALFKAILLCIPLILVIIAIVSMRG